MTYIINSWDAEKVVVEYTYEANNSSSTIITYRDAIDSCNHFRESLKPAFKPLANKINKVNEEVENNAILFKDNFMDKNELKVV